MGWRKQKSAFLRVATRRRTRGARFQPVFASFRAEAARNAPRAGSSAGTGFQPRTSRLSGAGPIKRRQTTSGGRCRLSEGVIKVAPMPARTSPMPLARGHTSSVIFGATPAAEKAARMRS